MIKSKRNVEMLTSNEVCVCTFKTLRDAANCMVAVGLAVNYTAAKTSISKVANKHEYNETAYGFKWEYSDNV